VDIHRKPGYDPAELFVDPRLRAAKLRIGLRMAQKVLGMRYLMDVIPSTPRWCAARTAGRPTAPRTAALHHVGSRAARGRPVVATEVKALLLDHVFGAAGARSEDCMNPSALLGRWLAERLSPGPAAWLETVAGRVRAAAGDRELYLAIGEVSRRVGREPLSITAAELREAQASRPAGTRATGPATRPRECGCCSRAPPTVELLARRLAPCAARRRGRTGRLLPRPAPVSGSRAPRAARRRGRALQHARGLRGVAHRNPYPAEQFAQAAWNQMVLKALFVGTVSTSSRASTRAPIRPWPGCSPTTRTSAGPPRAR